MAHFERDAICLSEVWTEWLLDFAFINLDAAALPPATQAPGLANDIRAHLPMYDELVARGERSFVPSETRANWKVVVDNFLECYYCRTAHPTFSETLRAEREVILAAGAFHSPQLLMLSGVGPADHLRDHGIAVAHELPGVGGNLQDHLEVHMQWRADRRHTRKRYAGPLARLVAGTQWFLTQRGVCSSTRVEVGAFTRTSSQTTHPDIQYHFFPFLLEGWRPSRRESGFCGREAAPQTDKVCTALLPGSKSPGGLIPVAASPSRRKPRLETWLNCKDRRGSRHPGRLGRVVNDHRRSTPRRGAITAIASISTAIPGQASSSTGTTLRAGPGGEKRRFRGSAPSRKVPASTP